jgi:hypothetical protein
MTQKDAEPRGFIKNAYQKLLAKIRPSKVDQKPEEKPIPVNSKLFVANEDYPLPPLILDSDGILEFIVNTQKRLAQGQEYNDDTLEAGTRINAHLQNLADSPSKMAWHQQIRRMVSMTGTSRRYPFPEMLPYAVEEPLNIVEISARRLGWGIRAIQFFKEYNSLEKLADNLGFDDGLKQAVEIQKMSPEIASVDMKLGSLSFADYSLDKPSSDQAADYVGLYTQAIPIHLGSHPGIGEANNRYPYNAYPHISDSRLIRAADIVVGSFLSKPEKMIFNAADQNSYSNETVSLTKRVIDNLNQKRGLIRRALTDPKMANHHETIAAFADFATQPGSFQSLLLIAFGLAYDQPLVSFFRQINGEQPAGKLGEDYQKVSEILEDHTAALRFNTHLTKADIASVIDEKPNPDSPKITNINTLHTLASSLVIRKSHGRDFLLDPKLIEGSGIVPPAAIEIHFDSASNCKFSVDFRYQSEQDDPVTLTVQLNTKKSEMDWNLLNSPKQTDPLVEILRTGVLTATQKLLSQIQTLTATTELKEPTPDLPIGNGKKKVKYSDPIYKIRKEARKGPQKNDPKTEELVNIEAYTGVAQVIALPEHQELDSLLANILPQDRDRVIKAIDNFNSTTRGDFRTISSPELKARGYDYRLRINCEHGTLRLMLQTIINMPGQQVFAPSDIFYRKNAYH